MNIVLTALLPCLLLLTACDRAPDQATSRQGAEKPMPAPAATPAEPSLETNGRGLLHVEPSSLATCEPAVVKVVWDTSSVNPAITDVKVNVIAPGESTGKLFAAGGAKDEAVTGAWAKPGLILQMRDASGNELDRVTVGGPSCP